MNLSAYQLIDKALVVQLNKDRKVALFLFIMYVKALSYVYGLLVSFIK